MQMRAVALFGMLASTLTACSNTPTTEACGVVGRERTCPCEARAIGIQACQMDGTWEACTCYPLPGGSSAAGVGGPSAAAGTSGVSGEGGATAGRAGRGFGLPFPFAGRTGAAGRRP